MATIPTINRTVRILPKDKKAQFWAPLVTAAGVLVSATRRSLVADVIARLMDAHLASSPNATFGMVEGGCRAVTDGVAGQGSPFFIATPDMSLGQVYLYGGAVKRDALIDALGGIGGGNVMATRDEGGSKAGLFITLAPDADVAKVYTLLALHSSSRGNVGFNSSMGAPEALEAVAYEAPPAVETPPVEATGGKGSKAPKGKRGRPKGSKGKAKDAPAPAADVEPAAS